MSEQRMRRRIIKALKHLDAVSVENPAHPGTPDVNFIEGWIELKQAERWPKSSEKQLRLPHFTPRQRLWLKRRAMRGGRVYLLLQVGQDWLLFNGDVAANVVGRATRQELIEKAQSLWLNGLIDEELIHAVLE